MLGLLVGGGKEGFSGCVAINKSSSVNGGANDKRRWFLEKCCPLVDKFKRSKNWWLVVETRDGRESNLLGVKDQLL